MQRILVAVEAIKEREVGRRRQIAHLARRRVGHRRRRRRIGDLAAEAAVLARHRAAFDRGDRRAVGVDEIARRLDDGGVARPLVDHLPDARPAYQLAFGRKRPMQHHLQVGVDHEPLVDAECRVGHAARPTEHHRHGGKRLEAGALVDEFELPRIERIHPEPDAERIENAVARAVAHGDVGGPIGHDPFVVERHQPVSLAVLIAPASRRRDRPAAWRSPCPRPGTWRSLSTNCRPA